MTVIVTGDGAAPGNVPGNVICQQAAQVRGVVPTVVEGWLGLVEGLEQPHIGVRAASRAPPAPSPTTGVRRRLTGQPATRFLGVGEEAPDRVGVEIEHLGAGQPLSLDLV